jgi:NLR family CARD domain-containing protein 3
VKYNDLLREFGANLEGCRGNKYVTTTHVINSAIVKLSKLTIATKVYRGVGGGVLPESFWRPNEQGVKGGIELAFMSTTFERGVAMKYAKSDSGKPALVFEMQMGMVDRGAELGWVSQYPHEEGERTRCTPALI